MAAGRFDLGEFDRLAPIKVAGDIPRALAAVTAAVGRGELSPDEGAALGSLIGATPSWWIVGVLRGDNTTRTPS